MNTLVLAEKPSVAKSISAVLGATQRQDGFFQGNGYLVSWCYGHLVELADPATYGAQYRRWSQNTLPILPEKWKYTASDKTRQQLEAIRTLMHRDDVESVVCATDAGREGELIFRLTYAFCKCRKPIHRLWISSLEDSAIREGFAKLRPRTDFDNLYRAALCRSQADWAVGINGTRLFSCLYGPTLNVGRVQTPTLAMIVQREKAIEEFVSKPFYTPEINCKDNKNEFTAAGKRYDDLEAAELVRTAADGKDAVVVKVEKAKKTAAPPRLYDLTSLQRDANRIFGYTAQQTLDYAQNLYESKYITYPRTDSQYLTKDMGNTAKAVIAAISGVFPFANALTFAPNISKVTNNSKVTDHHAIIPTLEIKKAKLGTMAVGQSNILALVALRLLCATAPVHRYEATTAVLECGGHKFTAKGKVVLEDGWKALDTAFRASVKSKSDKKNDKPDKNKSDIDNADKIESNNKKGKKSEEDPSDDENPLPEMVKGQVFPSVAATVREGKTKPPSRFTEGTLLRSMETASIEDMPEDSEHKGLGTPATRAGIIEKLINTGFVERQKKNLIPTIKGTNLIAVLPEDVKSPLLTAEWEQKLKQIERGELSATDFMSGISTLVNGLVSANTVPIPEMAALFATMPRGSENRKGSKGFSGKKPTGGKVVGKCPRCNADVVQSPKSYFCSADECQFALWADSRFWTAKGKDFTADIAEKLLSDKRVSFSDLKSERTGKIYGATIILEDNGHKTDYKMEFMG